MNKSSVYPMLLPETAFILLSIHIFTSLVTITIFIMLPVKVLKLCISAAKIIIELPRELALDVYVRMRTRFKSKLFEIRKNIHLKPCQLLNYFVYLNKCLYLRVH